MTAFGKSCPSAAVRACQVRTELVAFTVREGELCLALTAPRNKYTARRAGATKARTSTQSASPWRLPGASLADGEDLESCARRICLGVIPPAADPAVYLEQLYTFAPESAPKSTTRQDKSRHSARILRVAYFAVTAGEALADAALQWHPFSACPPLSDTHRRIVGKAHDRLAAKLHYTSLAFRFVRGNFTLSELQGIYETVWQTSLDKRNFRKRILALDGLIEETGRARRNGAHRPARLYRVKSPAPVQVLR